MRYVVETDFGMRVDEYPNIRSAWKHARTEVGTDHLRDVRKATDAEVAWYEAMSGASAC